MDGNWEDSLVQKFHVTYWEEINGWYVVARNFFLLLLTCSAWIVLNEIYLPFVSSLYSSHIIEKGLKIGNLFQEREFTN